MVGKGEPLGAMPDRAQSPALGQTAGRSNMGWEKRRGTPGQRWRDCLMTASLQRGLAALAALMNLPHL